MKKLKIEKWLEKDSNCGVGGIVLTRENKTLDIMFQGNLDLYFRLSNFKDDSSFIIAKDNYQIYELFNDLYNNIFSGNIFEPISDEDIEFLMIESEFLESDYHEILKEKLKYEEERRKRYKVLAVNLGLVVNDKIIWRCDDYSHDVAPFLIIEKLSDSYKLTFNKPKPKRELDYFESLGLNYTNKISIRFRNSGSSYSPFNQAFMKLYNDLMAIDFDYHQIHIEEYLLEEEMKLERTLK